MRERGEQVRDIARLARISEKQVRDLIRHAEAVTEADADGHDAAAQPAALPGPAGSGGSTGSGDGQAVSRSHEPAGLAAVGQ
jgi:hypothetical protein